MSRIHSNMTAGSRCAVQQQLPSHCRRFCLHSRAVQCQAHSEQQQQQQVRRPIEVSRSIAAARAAEGSRPDRLFQDPYAATLSGTPPLQAAGGSEEQQQQAVAVAMDVIATRYIDESLQNAMSATNVNTIQSGDYRQVVLLGDGMDSRPFRLLWPPGTLLFSVAPPEVHEQAEALLAAGQPPAHVMRGCLLRRVGMNLAAAAAAAAGDGNSRSSAGSTGELAGAAAGDAGSGQQQQQQVPSIFSSELLRAGFRPDRLSVWVLQGLHGQGLGPRELQQLLTEVTNCAAFHSLLVGELPGPLSKRTAENLLAEAGLLAAVKSHAQADAGEYGRWQEVVAGAATAGVAWESDAAAGEQQLAERWLCTAQQLRLSLEQMGIYDDWTAEFEGVDVGDDYIGNFS